MQTSKLNLDQSLHLRINKQFGEKLESIAFQNGMKTSALARFILTKHLHEIGLPGNLPAWMRWYGYDTITSRNWKIEEEVVVLCRVVAKHEDSSRECRIESTSSSHKEEFERKEGCSHLGHWSTKRAQELMFRKSVWNPMIYKSGGMLNLSGSACMNILKLCIGIFIDF